jgi:hypothetical protein
MAELRTTCCGGPAEDPHKPGCPNGERKPAAGMRSPGVHQARIVHLESALWAIMRVTDGGDLRTEASRRVWELITPARRIAREALGLPLMGGEPSGRDRHPGGAVTDTRCPTCHRTDFHASDCRDRYTRPRPGCW